MTFDLNGNGAVSDPLTIGTLIATSTIRNAGVETIVSATKPTTRKNGEALVADDLWYDIAKNILYFWNGTYWLTINQRTCSRFRQVSNNATMVIPTTTEFEAIDVPVNASLFLETVDYAITLNTAGDASNYRSLVISRRLTNITLETLYSSSVKITATTRTQVVAEAINTAYIPTLPNTAAEYSGFSFNFAATGTAPNGSNPIVSLYFRVIAP